MVSLKGYHTASNFKARINFVNVIKSVKRYTMPDCAFLITLTFRGAIYPKKGIKITRPIFSLMLCGTLHYILFVKFCQHSDIY